MADLARRIAVDALGDRQGNVSAHLQRLLDQANLPPAGRALATELALGCVQRRRTLDAILRAYLAQPKKPLPPRLRNILHVAIYQLVMLDRIPDFAAVSEAVQAAQRCQPKMTRMVNGLLRTLARELSEAQPAPAPRDMRAIPTAPACHRSVGRDILPDPQTQPAEHLAVAHSLPDELAQRWIRQFGLEKAHDLGAGANVPPPLICRVNALRTDVPGALERLTRQGCQARPHQAPRAIVLPPQPPLTSLAPFQEGWIQPQDPTAMQVALDAQPRPGQEVLDLCAAPGTKSTHLAELMQNRGRIVALDVSPEKLALIKENRTRMGASIIETGLAPTAGSLGAGRFDLALVDAPCSNTGVLSRRPEARWHFSAGDLGRLAGDQRFLLTAAAALVKPGGRLVYSTCSIEPEENEHVARWMSKQGRARLVRDRLTLPGGWSDPTTWHDGGYVAIFELR